MEETGPQRPIFDSGIAAEPSFFFKHDVDVSNASLHVRLLGPDLQFTFCHPHAHELNLLPRDIHARLDKKTAGFIALVTPPPSQAASPCAVTPPPSQTTSPCTHSILAWAESGHAAGATGLSFNPSPPALCNALWSTRALALASALGINMARPFDSMGSRCPVEQARRRGIFLASHVEVKLATHAIYALLQLCNISPASPRHSPASGLEPPRHSPAPGLEKDSSSLAAALDRLRNVEWSSLPSFDIFLSRKNCPPCAEFMHRIYAATRIRIRICWRHRVEDVSYKQIAMTGIHSTDRAQHLEEEEEDEKEEDEKEQDEQTGPLVITPTDSSSRAQKPRLPRADPLPVEKPLPATPETQAPSRSCAKPARRSILRHASS